MTKTCDNTDNISEEWFLVQLEQPGVEASHLLNALEAFRGRGMVEQSEAIAQLVQQTLVEKGRRDDALQVLTLRARWSKQPKSIAWADEILAILGATWEHKTLVEHVGFDKGIAPAESLRRLQLLRSLASDAICYDKTWGVGVVRKLDYFYKRVDIDFENKPGHHFSIAYAAEALKLLNDDHVLSWRYRREAELKDMVQNKAAEVVRMTLRSFGPMSVIKLQQTLVPVVVAESDWKRFWDQARKELKKDSLIDIPTSRNDPIRILDKEPSADAAWFAELAQERDLKKVVEHFDEWAEHIDVANLSEEHRNILIDRFRFVAKGVGQKHIGLYAHLLMIAQPLKLLQETDLSIRAKSFLDKKLFALTLTQLPIREARNFMRFLASFDREALLNLLVELMPTLEIAPLNEAFNFLFEIKEDARAIQLFKTALEKRFATIELLNWLSRNMEHIRNWSLGLHYVWLNLMIDMLEEKFMGERLKAQNQLRERFAKQDWLRAAMDEMDEMHRKKLLLRVKESSAWSKLDKQSVMANMIKLYPDLGGLLTTKTSQAEMVATRGPVTSWRTYRQRQAQLHKIVSVELPQVAKDIGIARSYGDLRENFEFKAAKEAQTVLARKRDELDQMLRQVRPTDFEGLPTDRAGLATGVVLQYEDGKTERYYILGEWDGEQTLGIISCTSRMAQALEGASKGAVITVPTEQGETRCTIADITPLPEEIRQWINATDPK